MSKKGCGIYVAMTVFIFGCVGLMGGLSDTMVEATPTPLPQVIVVPTNTMLPSPTPYLQCEKDMLPFFATTLTDLSDTVSNEQVMDVTRKYDTTYFDHNCHRNPYWDEMDMAIRLALAESNYPHDADESQLRELAGKSKLAIDRAWGVYAKYESEVTE